MASQDELKQQVAKKAVEYVKGGIIGVGTGSTANYFIDELAKVKGKIDGAVASSEATAQRLRSHGIAALDLNSVDSMDIYVDGADEITEHMHMLKGGGGALTREKIVAAVAKKFICICDASKLVPVLGKFPLPVEVLPMARSQVAPRAGQNGRPAQAARFHHRQRQRDSGCTWTEYRQSCRNGSANQPDRRRGDQRPVCGTSCRCAVAGYGGRRQNLHAVTLTSYNCNRLAI